MRIVSLAALLAALLLMAVPAAWADEGEPDLVEIEEIEIVEEEAPAAEVTEATPMPEAAPTTRPAIVTPSTPAPCVTPCAPATRRQWIPPRREPRCQTVTLPAVTHCYCVAEYEDVEVPVYKWECKPIYRDMSWPDMAQRCVPVTKIQMVPEYEDVEVPMYRTERIPVTKMACDPCTGQQTTVNCGFRVETVACGTRTVRRFKGWRKETVPCGTRLETYRRGTFTRPVLCGHERVRVQVGVRTEKRFKGWRQETMVLRPAKQVQQTTYVTIPGRCVETPCR